MDARARRHPGRAALSAFGAPCRPRRGRGCPPRPRRVRGRGHGNGSAAGAGTNAVCRRAGGGTPRRTVSRRGPGHPRRPHPGDGNHSHSVPAGKSRTVCADEPAGPKALGRPSQCGEPRQGLAAEIRWQARPPRAMLTGNKKPRNGGSGASADMGWNLTACMRQAIKIPLFSPRSVFSRQGSGKDFDPFSPRQMPYGMALGRRSPDEGLSCHPGWLRLRGRGQSHQKAEWSVEPSIVLYAKGQNMAKN